jgi:two-component system sensor histidine kinase AlgZ
VTALSIVVAPGLAAVCPGIAGHEQALVLRGVLLGGVYAVVGLASGHALRAGVRAQLAKERAERALIEARLDALTARTQPHFVANALNTIAQSLREDPAAAERLVEQLGQVFSHALSGSQTGAVSLADELDAARSYLGVQSARFGSRLEVSVAGDALGLDTPVPALCVLPLVENAVLHGLSTGAARVRVELEASRHEGGLRIEVRNDGAGPDASRHVGHGTGLRDLAQRLSLAYPAGGARVGLARRETWTVATLALPDAAPTLERTP